VEYFAVGSIIGGISSIYRARSVDGPRFFFFKN
jgi:hypothetical protein